MQLSQLFELLPTYLALIGVILVLAVVAWFMRSWYTKSKEGVDQDWAAVAARRRGRGAGARRGAGGA